MEHSINPFSPGAGFPPPEFVGRSDIFQQSATAVKRITMGRSGRSQMYIGLRGTGKTVLLNQIEEYAEGLGIVVSMIEAPEEENLQTLLYPKIHQALRKLSVAENAKHVVTKAMGALRNFAAVMKVEVGEATISIAPEPGVSESGILEYDLTDLFLAVGRAAAAAGKGWVLLIDEVQYLTRDELSALIVAIHRINQKGLPIIMCGGGLPQLAKLSGDAKSYAERLFQWHSVSQLDPISAAQAIREPVKTEGASITEDAIAEILKLTDCYPYFLQEWGHHCWNVADTEVIDVMDVVVGTQLAIQSLDSGFFQVRMDRLTDKEQEYVFAMSRLGSGPYKSSDIANELATSATNLTKRRDDIIKKGMIYSPKYGYLDFTVPMFDAFLNRQSDEFQKHKEPSNGN